MNLEDLSIDEIGSWPWVLRAVVIVIASIAVGVFSFIAFIKPKIAAQKKLELQQGELKAVFELKQYQAASLESYKRQLVEMQIVLRDMVKQLTDTREIPQLIEKVSRMGTSNGLEFRLIRPEEETEREYYAVLPIEISVVGSYHDIAMFINEISAMQKIITFDSFTIKRLNKRNRQITNENIAERALDEKKLIFDATARTYRYIERKIDEEDED
jgi:type IV pilus assembly protein PilO